MWDILNLFKKLLGGLWGLSRPKAIQKHCFRYILQKTNTNVNNYQSLNNKNFIVFAMILQRG